jgi:glucokinase
MAENAAQHYVGVDLAGPRLLAGGFSAAVQLLGKTKYSPKPERGPGTVIDRVARCVRDAVDECDLGLNQVTAIGLAVPGTVDAARGRVMSAPSLGWTDAAVKAELEQRLQIPVFLGNDCHVAALGIYAVELPTPPKRFVAVFPDRPGFAGVLVQGSFSTLPPGIQVPAIDFPKGSKPLPPRNAAKQLRKAIQSGNSEAASAAQAIADQTGAFVASLIDALRPDVVALGGGAIEELREWLLPGILKQVRGLAGPDRLEGVEIVVSELGKNTGMIGAAVLAARRGAA